MTLRKLLMSSGPLTLRPLQLALQWQYELLRSSQVKVCCAHSAANTTDQDVEEVTKCESSKKVADRFETSPTAAVCGMVSAECKPPSLSSFDSGFDGAGSSQLEAVGQREAVEGLSRSSETGDAMRPILSPSQICKGRQSSVLDCEDHREQHDVGSVGNSSRARIQIIPKVTADSLNFEITVKRSAALPSNPWLSLPVDDLENLYTVTITQNSTRRDRDLHVHDASDPCRAVKESSRSGNVPTQSREWMPHSHHSLEDPELSPICNILSSTISDGRDESVCTEGLPSLLWDSYDLHDQSPDSFEG